MQYKRVMRNADPLPPTACAKKKDKYVYDCSPCDICGYSTVVVIILLTLIFGILFIVLTAVGKQNTKSTSEGGCDCTLYSPSMGYGLGVSLLLEIGMMMVMFIFISVISLTKNSSTEKVCYGFCVFFGFLLIINYLGFLCTSITATVFVGIGGTCCSVTSIVVASLSIFLAAIKLLLTVVGICYVVAKDCDCTTESVTEKYLITVRRVE